MTTNYDYITKETKRRLKALKALVFPIALYGAEAWTLKAVEIYANNILGKVRSVLQWMPWTAHKTKRTRH